MALVTTALQRDAWADGQGEASMYMGWEWGAPAPPRHGPLAADLLDHGPELLRLLEAHQHAHDSADGAQGVVAWGNEPERLWSCSPDSADTERPIHITQRTWSYSSCLNKLAVPHVSTALAPEGGRR